MIWHELKKGIRFDNSDKVISWGIDIDTLKCINTPTIKESDGRIYITWNNSSLLNGIKGDWTTYFYLSNWRKKFTEIGLFYSGDKESFEAYDRIKPHLINLLGNPSRIDEDVQEKEISWEDNSSQIHLYLFEMHAFRCSLTVKRK